MDSIQFYCINPEDIEVLVCIDSDDEFIKCLDDYKIPIFVFFQPRKQSIIEYYEFLFSRSRGKVIWPLHDDCKIMTPGWDKISSDCIGDKWDKVWLGDTVDLVVEADKYRYSYDNFGGRISGMPMLSYKSIKVLGSVYSERFRHWGSTNMLYKIHFFAKTIIPINICVIHNPVKDELYDRIRTWWVEDTRGKITTHDLHKEVNQLISNVQ